MAVLHACGFECRVTASSLPSPDERHWAGFGTAAPTYSTSTVRESHVVSLRNNSTSAQNINHPFAAGNRTISGRVYLRVATFPTAGEAPHIVNFQNASGNGVIRVAGTGTKLQILCGASAAVDVATLSTGQWYRIDFQFDTSGATATFKCQVDGGTQATASNAQAAADSTNLRFGTFQNTTVAPDFFYSDLDLDDTLAAHPIGPGFVYRDKPTRDSGHSFTAGDFGFETAGADVGTGATDVYTHLDDDDLMSTADLIRQKVIRTTGYVQVGFGTAPLTHDPVAVNVVSSFHAAGTGADTFGLKANDGGTLKNLTNEAGTGLTDVSQTTIMVMDKLLTSAPSGGAWTKGKLEALLIRGGYSDDVNAIPYWDGLMLEVVYRGVIATPTTAALTLTTFAPTIAHKIVGASPTALTLTTFAPTVTTGAPVTVTPTTVALTLTTFAPTIAHKIVAGLTALALTAFAPVIALTVTPTTAALTTTTFAPVIALTVTPTTLALSLTAFAPTVTATANQLVTPTTASLSLTTFAPTAAAPRLVVPQPVKTPVVTSTDSYTRSVATGLGGSWIHDSGDESEVSVDGSKAVVVPGLGNRYHIGAALSDAELEVLVTFGANSAPGGANLITLALDTSGNRYVQFHPNVFGSSLLLFAGLGVSGNVDLGAHTPGTQYHFKARFVGTQIQAKAWPVGDPEPDWQLNDVAGSAVAGPAYLEFGADLADNYLDDFSATELRDLALTTFAPVIALTVTPSTAALTLTTFAPTVTASDHQTVTPTTAALSLTTFAPTVSLSDNQLVTPTTASLSLTTFAPVIGQTVTPTTASLTLTAYAPTVSLSDNQSVTPTTASLTTSSFAPVIALSVTPTTASLTLTAFAPVISVSDNQSVTPSTAALTLTTFAPTVTATDPQTVTPTTAALTLTTFAPIIAVTDAQALVPQPASLTLTTFEPIVTATNPQLVTPDPASLTTATFAPTVTASNHQTVTPTTASLSLTTFAPTVSAAGEVNLSGSATGSSSGTGRLTVRKGARGPGVAAMADRVRPDQIPVIRYLQGRAEGTSSARAHLTTIRSMRGVSAGRAAALGSQKAAVMSISRGMASVARGTSAGEGRLTVTYSIPRWLLDEIDEDLSDLTT